MKKIIFAIFIMMFALLPVSGEETPVIKDVEGFWYAHMEFTGPYSNMKKEIPVFMGEFFKQGLIPAGQPVSAYFNSLDDVKEEELKWAFGFPVAKGTTVKEPLKLTEFKAQKAAVYLHIGPYEKLLEAYNKILKFIDEKGFKEALPSYDKYLNTPQQVKPEELKTQIIIPVVKK